MAPELLPLLRCPISRKELTLKDGRLITQDGEHSYPLDGDGIPLFAVEGEMDAASAAQQAHFDQISQSYIQALHDPQSQEYMAYLDQAMLELAGPRPLGTLLEICCGHGEGLVLLSGKAEQALGIDLSLGMLKHAADAIGRVALLQGNATSLPLADASIDTVVTIGGVHHVPDRLAMFREIRRVLKPGGRFLWREPVSDFFLWRLIRAVVYRLSPQLDAENEAPLRYDRMKSELAQAGLGLQTWRTVGMFGFMLFMNGDVLLFNRIFRFLPGIRKIVRAAAALDNWMTISGPFAMKGLLVLGEAVKIEDRA